MRHFILILALSLRTVNSWTSIEFSQWKTFRENQIAGHQRTTISKSVSSSLVGKRHRDRLVTTLEMKNSEKSVDVKLLKEKSPIGLTLDQLTKKLGGRGRALSCWDCYRKGVDPTWFFGCKGTSDAIEPKLEVLGSSGWPREEIFHKEKAVLGDYTIDLLKGMANPEQDIAQLSHITKSKDGTTKLLLKLRDNLEVETVIIPWPDRKRSTLCISSQVGCRQGCTFCATGRMGIIRSLTTEEILTQVYFANKICRIGEIYPIDNIVFMGMGEPADNACEVVKAAKTLVDRNMFGLTGRRVTISTVGPNPDCFSELAEAPVTLAWSVHATRQKVRKALVPTTKHSMQDLRDGLLKAIHGRSRRLKSVMLEIALLNGQNDSYEDAMDLVEFCQPIQQQASKLIVNLIPWNDINATSGAASSYQKPTFENVIKFQNILRHHGIRCYTRITRGDEESSACGQLATKKTASSRKQKNQLIVN